ncbi:MAG: glycosyltransferase family 39 protein [Candidatus Aureabacteria bacterium]|nr:glycosyltransferase family 39 protein [Candidatus Auribacterota bacterium]
MDRNCIRILILYCLLASLYAFGVPLWEAPDEPSHYLCIRRISDGQSFRPPRPSSPAGKEWSETYLYSLYERAQPPLYYLLAAPAMKVLSLRLLPLGGQADFPSVRYDFQREGNLFVRHRDGLFPIPANEIRGHLIRLLSILAGAGSVYLIYRLALSLDPDSPPLALLAGGFAATLPQFTFISAMISNDSLAVLIGAGALFLLARIGEGTASGRDRLGAGFLLALGLATKGNLLFLFPVAALALIIGRYSGLRRRGRLARAAPLFLPSAVLLLLAALVSPRATLLRARFMWLRLSLVDPALIAPDRLRLMFAEMFQSFFARFGWMSISVGGWLYWSWAGLFAVSIVGGIVGVFRSDRGGMPGKVQLLFLAAFLILFAGVIKNNLLVPQHQGRYLFPALPAIAVLFATGWLNLFPRRSWKWIAPIGVLILAALNLAAFFGYLIPASYP